jgi:hypothetical protein
MKTLYESILGGFNEIETDFVKEYSSEWLEFIINAKSQTEFENHCKNLKKTLDVHLGKNYDNALTQTKKIRRGPYICISHKKDASDMQWFIYVNSGPDMIELSWDSNPGKVSVHRLLHRMYDFIDTRSKGYGNGKNRFYTYVCDNTWNDIFRMPLINKYKSIK